MICRRPVCRGLIVVVSSCLCGVTEGVLSLLAPRDGDLDNDSWDQVTRWMRLNGAEIDLNLVGNATSHGGNTIRGVVSSSGLKQNEILLQIPYKLWFVSDHFPEIHHAKLDEVEGCGGLMKEEHQRIKTAAALAVEMRRGNASFFHPWILTLPTLKDFKAFHPMFAANHVIKDFGITPSVKLALTQQGRDRNIGWCFDSWKNVRGSPVSHVQWEDDMQLAFAMVRTRTYSTSVGHAMIPGADLLNTGPASALNTDWEVDTDVFSINALSPVGERKEVYDEYCTGCNNYRMLSIWGVYMEDNINSLRDDSAKFQSVNCSSWTWGGRRPLRAVVEETLDISHQGLAFANAQNFTAPRCRPEAIAGHEQGPLRCSLSRLVWEHCAPAWSHAFLASTANTGNVIKKQDPVVTPSMVNLDHFKEAVLLDQSGRHGVHPELLAETRTSSSTRLRHGKGPERPSLST